MPIESEVVPIPMSDPLLSGYEFGHDGPAFAWYRNGSNDDAPYMLYGIIESGDHKNEVDAVYHFNEAFHDWLAGRSTKHVVWRRRPSVTVSKRGAKLNVTCRCVYDPEFKHAD